MNGDLSREELFLLVWERPIKEVAKELGISDTVLNKQCRQLQVPKPPPGYWMQIKSGKRPRKPLLNEFSDQISKFHGNQAQDAEVVRGWIHLSPLQIAMTEKAIDALRTKGVDLEDVQISSSGVKRLTSDLASQLILVIQNQYIKWLREQSNNDRIANSSIRSVQSLVAKLLPLASAHILVLQKRQGKHDGSARYPKIIIRLTPEFRQQVANLHRVVTENALAYVVWDLSRFEHAWVVQYHYHHEDSISAKSQICISKTSLWLISTINQHRWDDDHQEQIETEEIPINEISPVELLMDSEQVLPTTVELTKLSLSKERVQAFIDAEQALDILSSTIHKSQVQGPGYHLALFEKLRMSEPLGGPITAAQNMIDKIEVDMERWERVMESEREAICSNALGFIVGDTILAESKGKPIRLKVSQLSTHISKNNTLRFDISGKRYRKDGVLGKRQEYLSIETKPSADDSVDL